MLLFVGWKCGNYLIPSCKSLEIVCDLIKYVCLMIYIINLSG